MLVFSGFNTSSAAVSEVVTDVISNTARTSTEPVSYTHLDVYKRQPPEWIIRSISFYTCIKTNIKTFLDDDSIKKAVCKKVYLLAHRNFNAL